MPRDASDLARRLARDAEAVCRHYLSNGRRQGRYWMVGDVRNAPGRSMFVRLSGPESGAGAAGRWTDAATAEFGDLLDVIRESCGFGLFGKTAFMAERVLGNVVSSGIKVLVLAVIIGIGSTLFGRFTTGFGGVTPTVDEAMAIVLAALSLLGLGIFGPGIASGLVSGGLQLGAGAGVGTGLAVGGAALAAGGGAMLAARGGGAALSGATAAVRGGAAAAGAASSAYTLGASGQSGAAGVASGIGGVAHAAGSAATSPLRRVAARGVEGVRSSYAEGARKGVGATGGSFSAGTIGGSAGSAASESRPFDGPPDWARRLRRGQAMRHGVSAAAHAISSGDGHGGGASVSLRTGDRS